MSNVGIGSSAPTSQLDVLGNSKFVGVTTLTGITTSIGTLFANRFSVSGVSTFAGAIDANGDLDVDGQTDLDVLNVAESATFAGIATFNSQIFTNKISNLGIITSNIIHLTGDTFSTPAQSPGDTESDAAIIVNENFHIYPLEEDGRRLRNLIEKTSDKITIGQQNTELINSIELKPGGDGTIRLHYGGSTDNVKFETSGIGATVYGQLDTNNLNVTGVSTFADDIFIGTGATVGFGTTAYFRDNAKAVFGDNENLAIYFNGNNSVIEDQGSGNTILSTNGNGVFITKNNGSASIADFRTDESVILYHDGNEKFRTTNEGVLVSGGTTTGTLSVTGVSTFVGLSTFKDGIFVTGVSTFSDKILPDITNSVDIGSSEQRWNTLFIKDINATGGSIVVEDYETDRLQVNGISTFIGLSTFASGIEVVSGTATFGDLVDINAGGQANTFKVEDLTEDRVVIVGAGGELEDSPNLTFNGSTLAVIGDGTFSGNVSIAGTLTYEDVTNVDSIGLITARNGIHVTGAGVSVSGISTFINNVEFQDKVGIGTDDPDEKLHVVTTSSDATPILLERTHTNNVIAEFKNSTASMYAGLAGNALGWGVGTGANLGGASNNKFIIT